MFLSPVVIVSTQDEEQILQRQTEYSLFRESVIEMRPTRTSIASSHIIKDDTSVNADEENKM
jgi:hypothetical protein